MNSDGWSGKSSRVTTALTPGSASAFEVSIETMRACGWGLRSTRPMSWPARLKSAPKRARPVTLSTPSGRMVRVPTYVLRRCPVRRRLGHGLSLSHCRGGVHHRADDLVVAGAPAEVAGQPVADLGARSGWAFARAAPCWPPGSPGVQIPHWSAACSRNRCCSGWSVSPLAMPSMVSTWRPGHLAAQHEARADQPAVQHDAAGAAVARRRSLPCCRSGGACRGARRAASPPSRRGTRPRLRSPSPRCGAWPSVRPRSVQRDQGRPARQHAGDLDAELDRASLVVDGPAGRPRRRLQPVLRRPGPAGCPTMAWAASGTSSTRAATAPSDTRAAVIVPAAVEGQAHARAHHGDVHLRARDEAQVGVARARRPGRQQEGDDDLALARARACGARA